MKAGIVLVIIIAIGFAVWKIKEMKRVKSAEALKLHKATLRAAKPVKAPKEKKRHEIDDDTKLKNY